MMHTSSPNWSILSTELGPKDFLPEIRCYAVGIVDFLDRMDHYRPLLGGLRSYEPLIDAMDELGGELEEAIGWLNDYLDGRLWLTTLRANLKDNASAQLTDALQALADVSLGLPEPRQEAFAAFYCDDETEQEDGDAVAKTGTADYLMDDDGHLSVSGIDEGELKTSDELFSDEEIDLPFLHAVNGLINDSETLADRIIRDLIKHGYALNDVFIEARMVD